MPAAATTRTLLIAGVVALVAVAGVGWYAAQHRPAETAAPPPAAAPTATTQPAPPPAATAPVTTQSETEQARASQETGATDTDHSAKSDASLERMTALPPAAQLPEGRWKPGVNYQPLLPSQPTDVAAGKVEVMEVFWFACPHCYALEPFLVDWLKKKPAYVEFVRVPVIWDNMKTAHARLYYTLAALGREDLFEKAFALAQQVQSSPLAGSTDAETLRLQQAFAAQNGISADDYAKAFNSFSVNSNMTRAQEITQRYRVDHVPFFVVNGKYTTDVSMAGSETQLIQLISDLAASEHH
jgi:protein dithiol oxidoreductase (disulfide-forming)